MLQEFDETFAGFDITQSFHHVVRPALVNPAWNKGMGETGTYGVHITFKRYINAIGLSLINRVHDRGYIPNLIASGPVMLKMYGDTRAPPDLKCFEDPTSCKSAFRIVISKMRAVRQSKLCSHLT